MTPTDPDHEAFIRAYVGRLHNYLKGCGFKDSTLISEAVNDAFMAAKVARNRGKDLRDPFSYLKTVAYHSACKQAGNQPSRELPDQEYLEQVVDSHPSVVELLLESQQVQQWLGQLPPRQREVVTLRYLADYSVLEVAGKLGIAPQTVKEIARDGCKNLRRIVMSQREIDRGNEYGEKGEGQ
ncbi:RNA polymerase sigma factor [Nonomuraea sp. NPDC050153]|uniref:RNA polymerase sigma factor n=1 Tax=Nonomuraea sp. NPDC050153 TaxID=3364359 RepID=UPI00379458C2